MTREVRMDGQFIVFFLALGVPLVFGACIGAAFRGRFGRGLGLVTLALGLAGLLYGALTFTTYRDGYGLFAWVALAVAERAASHSYNSAGFS